MLVPSSVSTHKNKLSEPQRQALGRYIERHVEHDAWHREPLMLALVVAGDKPAALIDPASFAFPDHPWSTHTGLLELCDVLELSYRHVTDISGWFVAPAEGRLDLLPSTGRAPTNDAWHRRFGVVLGYPPDAIDFFIETSGDERTRPRDLVDRGVFSPDELAFTQFIFYIHDDSIDGYEQAITEGKIVRERFEELAAAWGLPDLKKIAAGVHEESRRVFAGEQERIRR